MKNTFVLLLWVSAFLVFSCKQEPKYGEPVVQSAAIISNEMAFWNYLQKYVQLAPDFTALDSAEAVVDRGAFMKKLSTGRYFPLRLRTKDSLDCYQLQPIPDTANAVRTLAAQWGEHLYALYQMEGKPLPAFHLVDMNGNAYSAENTRGKLLVLKCWFLHCVACVKEMPALNKLVKQYAGRADVKFISFVPDKKASVDSFLKRTQFDYAVVPEKRDYVWDTLGITMFPTHIVVNKQGIIARVMNDEKELAVVLKKEAAK